MPVTQRGSAWQAQVNHKGQRYRRDFPTREEAQRWHDETKKALVEGTFEKDDGKPRTLRDILSYTLKHHWKGTSSYEAMKLQCNVWLETLDPNLPLSSIGRFQIDKALAEFRKAGNSDATLNRKLAVISKALTVAEELGVIDRKPKLPRFREIEHRTRTITPEEEKQLIGFFELQGDEGMRDFVIVGLDTGMRRGEILKLTGENLEGRSIRLFGDQTKNAKGRTIPLTERAWAVLNKRKERGGDRLFSEINAKRVNDRWNDARAAMGLSLDHGFTPHAMRHTFCSRLGRMGLNAQTIQAMSGHKTLSMLQRYTHMDEETLAKAIERMEGNFTLPK